MTGHRCFSLTGALYLAFTLAGWTASVAAGPASFPPGSYAVYFSPGLHPEKEDDPRKYIKVVTPNGDDWFLVLEGEVKEVWDVDLIDDQRNEQAITEVAIVYGEGLFTKRPATDFVENLPPRPGNAVAGARQAPVGVVSIAVSNDADAFDLTCDGRAVVVGANSATPVSLIDVRAQVEVAKVTYGGPLARAVSVGDDERTVLVVLDNATNNTANTIRRLTLGPGNTLTDAGEQLLFGADYVRKVRVAPGSKVGVALVGQFPARIVSFSISGLAIMGSVTLAQGIGNAIAFSQAGDRVYARSGRRGIVPDVIEGFAFDPVTGAIDQTAALTINNIAGFNGVAYNDPMAMTSDGTALVVAEQAPVSLVTRFNPANGASLGSSRGGNPSTVGTGRACATGAQRAIEYYHAAFDHYFVTSIADEITKLDNGTFAGWARSGYQFNVYAAGAAGTVATCRFFSTAFGERSSHFYTPIATECATVKGMPEWQFEGEVFNLALTADGSCAAGSVPLYRLYNDGQGGAPNHRYTTRTDVRAQMIERGWVPEGAGVGVIGCVPAEAAAATR